MGFRGNLSALHFVVIRWTSVPARLALAKQEIVTYPPYALHCGDGDS